MTTVYRLILYARLLYSLILVNYFNNIPQDMMEKNLNPVSEVLEEIDGCMRAVHSICKAAADAFSGFFVADLTSDPTLNLALRKFNLNSSLINKLLTSNIFFTLSGISLLFFYKHYNI